MPVPHRGSAIEKAVRDDAAARAFEQQVRSARVFRIAAAKTAVELDRKHHFIYEGCASFGEFGERHGLSAADAWALLAMGMAMEKHPEMEQELLSGQMPEESASRMGKLLKFPGAMRPDEEWLVWAKSEPAKAFKRRVDQRLEELRRSGPPTVERTFYVSQKGADGFEKARTIASRKAGAP